MTQIGFPLEQAHEALDQFLNDPDRDHDGRRMSRWIGVPSANPGPNREYDEIVANIVGPEEWDEMRNGWHQWRAAEQVREEAIGPPPGYTPWKHSPLASQDRLLPVEPLLDTLARAIFRKPYAELGDDSPDQWHVRAVAIMCLLEVQLDADGQGAVPVLMRAHDLDEPGSGLRWQIAYRTEVRGLYLRVTGNGFFGEEWGIVTGSGYKLASGWYDRGEAAAAVSALGRVLPNADWMRLDPDGFTDRAKKAIAAVIRRYRQFGVNENAPEPEVMEDAVPAPSAEMAALAAPAEAVTAGD